MEASAMVSQPRILPVRPPDQVWAQALVAETGIRVASCYQCLRCTNSCPVAQFMDVKPHQVVRLTQLGRKDPLLGSSTIWICLSCEMCTTYCPNEIDVAGLMNHLKNMVVAAGRRPAAEEIALFHQIFLDVLRRYGRINDLQLIQRYKLKLLGRGYLPHWKEVKKDIRLGLGLVRRGRLRLLPERSKAAKEIRRVIK